LGIEIRHLNGIAWDNTVGNLQWGTSKENKEDAVGHGAMCRQNGRQAKLTKEDVLLIRRSQISAGTMARGLGVSRRLVCLIREGKRWVAREFRGKKVSFTTSVVLDVTVADVESSYGLTVEEDHSHVVGGIVTHNTGRMSSSDPNLQNFSQDNDERALSNSGKSLKDGGVDPWSVRRAFIVESPRKPRLIIDYSQIELRVLAYYSKDPIMVDNYLKGGDIHKRTAEEVGVTRRVAKVINFGLSYCLTAQGMARQVGISVPEAEHFMEKFFKQYAGISSFREYFWDKVRRNNGQFSNCFGRTRRVSQINSGKQWERGRAERQAIGTLVQGTAAELTKEALVRIDDWLVAAKIPACLTSTVHDELWIDSDVECVAEVGRNAKRLMEDFPEFDPIPITVSGSYTMTNWAEKKEAF
jgi:DNA polymerase-1